MRTSERRQRAETAAAAWIARRERDDWSDADQVQLDEWIAQSLDNRVAWLRLSTARERTGRSQAVSAGARPFTTHGISRPPGVVSGDSGRRTKGWRQPGAIAAAMLLCAYVVFSRWPIADRTYETEIGAVTAVPLSDGSRVTLNTDTRVQVRLSDAERRVQLTQGEAYFEVAKDTARRFVVASAGARVIAVGTQFSVRVDGDELRVFVTEGTVQIEQDSAAGGHPAVRLMAGSIAHLAGADVIVQHKPIADIEQLLSWRQGFLFFDDIELGEAVAELNRYSKRKIVIADPSVAAIRIGGNFRATNAAGFLRLIRSDLPVTLTEDGDRVVIAAAAAK